MKLDRESLPDSGVQARLAGFETVRYDSRSTAGDQMARRYGVSGFPTMVVVDPRSGREIKRIVGFRDPAALSRDLSGL